MEDLIFEDEAPATARKPGKLCLPDGTQLKLTAGILVDLASIFHDEFTAYVPSKNDEFAFLLWMASHKPAEWRESSNGKPLIADFISMRGVVLAWIDETFQPSEADLVRTIALDLWMHHAKARVVITEKKTE
jgi:hypothetical protein